VLLLALAADLHAADLDPGIPHPDLAPLPIKHRLRQIWQLKDIATDLECPDLLSAQPNRAEISG